MTDRLMPSEAFGTVTYLVEAHPVAPERQPLWIELTVCYSCGALVHDTDDHMAWHVWLNEKMRMLVRISKRVDADDEDV